MGLLDRVMDMVFLPNTGSVVVRSSQGRFFLFNRFAQSAGPGAIQAVADLPFLMPDT